MFHRLGHIACLQRTDLGRHLKAVDKRVNLARKPMESNCQSVISGSGELSIGESTEPTPNHDAAASIHAAIECCDLEAHQELISLAGAMLPPVRVVDIRHLMPMPGDNRCFEQLLGALVALKGAAQGDMPTVTTLSPYTIVHVFARYLCNMGRIDSEELRILTEVEALETSAPRQQVTHALIPACAVDAPYSGTAFHYKAIMQRSPLVKVTSDFRGFFAHGTCTHRLTAQQ